MGRTNPTFRMQLEGMKSRWNEYRRALRRQDQPHFDRLFEHADAHADAAGYLNSGDPFDPVLLSMLLEHQKRIHDLEAALDAVESDDVRDAHATDGGGDERGVDATDGGGDVRDTDAAEGTDAVQG